MKGIVGFKDFIKKFVTVFASREFAFIYCLIGTFGQISHCYYLLYSVSSFNGFFKVFQAVLLALFISSSLMYFVAIADSDADEKEYKRIKNGINMFMVLEIMMNMYYYCQHLIIQSHPIRIFDFIFGAVMSVFIPITIKMYSNSIKAKEWIKEIESRNQPKKEDITDTNNNTEEIKNFIIEQFGEIKDLNNSHISETIEKMFDERFQTYQKGDGTSVDDLIFKQEILKIVREEIEKNNQK